MKSFTKTHLALKLLQACRGEMENIYKTDAGFCLGPAFRKTYSSWLLKCRIETYVLGDSFCASIARGSFGGNGKRKTVTLILSS